VFFNLTNAQWYLGVALIVNCALPSAGRMRILESAFIVVAALTGPFSIYLMPVLLAKMVLFGDFEVRRREYITISICGAIQLFYVLISPRIYEKGVVDHDIWHWTHVLWTLLTFGNSLPWASIVWILFWLIWIWILLSYCVERLREGDKAFLFAVCAFVVLGCAILASGLFVGREFPGWFTPMGFGSRYFVPLYILSFLLIAIAASERHYLKWFLLTLYARS